MRVDLAHDERVVVRTRPHPRALAGAGWALVSLMALAGSLQGLLSRLPELGGVAAEWAPVAVIAAWVLLGFLALVWVLRPVLSWLRKRYVITTRRVLSVQGRHRRELPLTMLTGVQGRPGVGAGAEGSGTLHLYTQGGEAKLKHMPSVRRAAALLFELRAAIPLEQAPYLR